MMITDLSKTDWQHLANLRAPDYSLIPHRCPCGKAAPAKQLAQHQRCVACLFAARAATILADDLDVLHHMLGATSHRPQSQWGLRNEYVANREDLPALGRLVAAGFVRAGAALLDLRYFHATQDGCKLAGLNYAAMTRAQGARP